MIGNQLGNTIDVAADAPFPISCSGMVCVGIGAYCNKTASSLELLSVDKAWLQASAVSHKVCLTDNLM